jgi:hypothetical protein
MKVKLLTSRVLGSGHTQDFGDEIEVSNAEGARLVAAGQGIELGRPETAMRRGGRENATNPGAQQKA